VKLVPEISCWHPAALGRLSPLPRPALILNVRPQFEGHQRYARPGSAEKSGIKSRSITQFSPMFQPTESAYRLSPDLVERTACVAC